MPGYRGGAEGAGRGGVAVHPATTTVSRADVTARHLYTRLPDMICHDASSSAERTV
jgi:hypothetical protein